MPRPTITAEPQIIGGRPLHPSWRIVYPTAAWWPVAAPGVLRQYASERDRAVRHCVVATVGELDLPLALCRPYVGLDTTRTPGRRLPRCAGCIRYLTRRGLWPL